MASEVGLLSRFSKEKKDPITRDLLGGCCAVMDSKDLDLGLTIESGADSKGSIDILNPGKMYLRNNIKTKNNPLQDLNLPPTTFSLNIPQSSPKNSSLSFPSNYQSVCTIEKVKSALERMGRESRSKSFVKSDGSPSPSSSSITSSSPLKRQVDQIDGYDSSRCLMASACPNCLLYVLISRENPRCPKCDSYVPQPNLSKNNDNNNKKMKIGIVDRSIDVNTTLNLF